MGESICECFMSTARGVEGVLSQSRSLPSLAVQPLRRAHAFVCFRTPLKSHPPCPTQRSCMNHVSPSG